MEEKKGSARVQKSIKNLVYGSFAQFLKTILGFVSRIALVRILGNEAASLNGLFTEVITMISLAEMGVGQAIIYNLYAPLKNHDEKKLTELMNLFKTAYRIIAAVIFGIGLACLPFIHLLISKVEIDLGYLRLIYLLFLFQTASSYLFSYNQSLLNADQKNYIVSNYSIAVRTIFTVLSVIFLVLTKNFVVYLIIQIAMTLAINIAVSTIAYKTYPFLRKKDKISKDERKTILSNVKHLFIGTLSWRITCSTDNILISKLVGTLSVGAYSSYSLIINAMTRFLEQFGSATSGSVGNLMAEGDKRHIETTLKRMTFVHFIIAMLGSVVFFCVSTPMIKIMFGESYVMQMPVVFVCACNLFLLIVRGPLWQFMRVSGLFSKDKNTSIAGSVVNLVVSIILGRKLGILGILLGTTCTHIIQIVLKTMLFYREYLSFSAKRFSLLYAEYSVCTGAALYLCWKACNLFSPGSLYVEFAAKLVVSMLLSVLIILALFGRTEEFRYLKELVKKQGARILKKIR